MVKADSHKYGPQENFTQVPVDLNTRTHQSGEFVTGANNH